MAVGVRQTVLTAGRATYEHDWAKLIAPMLRSALPHLRCPFCAGGPVVVSSTNGSARPSTDRIDDATLICQACSRTTEVHERVWHAMADHAWSKTPAQISNVVPPTPQLYERLWRVRSLSLLSGRKFPVEEELAELVAALRPMPGQVFADVACSEGLYARTIAATGATVFAVDHSRPFLRRMVARAGDLPVIAVRAMAQHLPFVSGVLDGSAMGGSLNEIGDQSMAVAELARVVKPGGGVFSMSLSTATTAPGRVLQRILGPMGISVPTKEATLALFVDAGAEIVDERLDRIVVRVTARAR
jgi:SAM-dependent methyltransferase